MNFRLTESFYPAGTILLFAEIDRIVSLSNLPKPITILDPRMRRPREVLKQIGIHAITGDSCDVVPERDDVVYWKSSKGVDQSGESMAILEAVATKVNRKHADQLELAGVWRGVSEAVANTVDHAYLAPRSDGFTGLPGGTKWWMFTQLRGGVFTVAVCDLGCGYEGTIRKTLPERFLHSFFAGFGGKSTDALAIQAAMVYGRSGTKLTERGKGSRDAVSLLEKHGEGDLLILSNSGLVQCRYKDGRQQSQTSAALGIDIRGTIVMWKLPIKEAEDEDS